MNKFIMLLFLALTFNSLNDCQSWLDDFESRWTHSPEWHYAIPAQLRDGRYYVPIIDSALPKLTETEKAQLVDLIEADLPGPPEVP